MLTKLKHYAVRGMSAIVGVALFLFMLPLTLGMMLLMILTGAVTMATLRQRAARGSVQSGTPKDINPQARPAPGGSQKAPIEGSYTLIDN